MYGQEARFLLLERSTVALRTGLKMLICQICQATAEVLAHQIRGRETVMVCLDCANRHYQDELTRKLILAEKVGA